MINVADDIRRWILLFRNWLLNVLNRCTEQYSTDRSRLQTKADKLITFCAREHLDFLIIKRRYGMEPAVTVKVEIRVNYCRGY